LKALTTKIYWTQWVTSRLQNQVSMVPGMPHAAIKFSFLCENVENCFRI